MKNGYRTRILAVALAVLATLYGCERERRDFTQTPSGATAIKSVRMSDLVPDGSDKTLAVDNRYDDNAYALAEGKRLFHWYNCTGCHAEGGGGSGPALMDNVWIYGSESANVFATIVQGRPNGMPAFGGRIPEKEVWELVAYVRSMSGLVSSQAAPNRADAMHAKKPESEVERQPPVDVSTPRP
jgi:cytochrome c oxidase cbb3-type subunit III